MTRAPDGLVFDLDGTLADTAVIGRAALDATVAAFGITPTGDAMALNGRAFADRIRIMRENGDLDGTITDADLLAECDRQLITRAAAVRPITPVVDILRRAHGRVPLALATGSTGAVAAAVVAAIGLGGVFDAVVTRDDVPRGKPAPDTYLRAAALLGLDPARCEAYEDTAIGLEAARAAGMSVVDVRPLLEKQSPS